MNNKFSLILTCTVDVNGVEQMARADPVKRLDDYIKTFKLWIENPYIENIIFTENSGYDLNEFYEISKSIKHNKNIEFLSFNKNNYPRSLGKGYGEYLTLKEVVQNSKQLCVTKRFLKITGRYYIENIKKIIEGFGPNIEIYCNLTKGLTYSDSRVFGGSLVFLNNYLCFYGSSINDSKKKYIEHALAESFLRGVSDGLIWRFLSDTPIINGYSGTLDKKYENKMLRRFQKNIAEKIKEYLIKKY